MVCAEKKEMLRFNFISSVRTGAECQESPASGKV